MFTAAKVHIIFEICKYFQLKSINETLKDVKLKLNKFNIKLYKINIFVEAALETILQSVTLAFVMLISLNHDAKVHIFSETAKLFWLKVINTYVKKTCTHLHRRMQVKT